MRGAPNLRTTGLRTAGHFLIINGVRDEMTSSTGIYLRVNCGADLLPRVRLELGVVFALQSDVECSQCRKSAAQAMPFFKIAQVLLWVRGYLLPNM